MNFYSAASVIRNHKLYFTVSLCTLSGAILYNYLRNQSHRARLSRRKTYDLDNAHEEKLIVENEHIPALAMIIMQIEDRTNTTISFGSALVNCDQRQLQHTAATASSLDLMTHENRNCDVDVRAMGDVVKSVKSRKEQQACGRALDMHGMGEKSTHQICTIRGEYGDVKDARYMLLKEIERLSIVKEEISFSKDIYRKFYNNECEVVQELNRITSAKVDTNFAVETDTRKMRITMTGNKYQVGVARKLIEATVKDWEVKTITDKCSLKPETQNDESEPFFKVNVSALVSPGRFWIQLVDPKGRQLEDLMAQLAAFYENPNNLRNSQLKNPKIGDIVAAFFPRSNRWYRAEIVAIIPQSRDNPNDVRFDLFFVDYGNSEYSLPCYLFELHDRFKNVSYQAAECFLVNVHPFSNSRNDHWEEDATCYFENLTDNINGKVIICHILTYEQRSYNIGNTRRSVTAAGVELYYVLNDVVVNIGKQMIANGYARPAQKQYSSIHDTQMLQAINQGKAIENNEKNTKNAKNLTATKNHHHHHNQQQQQLQQQQLKHGGVHAHEAEAKIHSSTVRATEATTTKTTSTTTMWHDEKVFTKNNKKKEDPSPKSFLRNIFLK